MVLTSQGLLRFVQIAWKYLLRFLRKMNWMRLKLRRRYYISVLCSEFVIVILAFFFKFGNNDTYIWNFLHAVIYLTGFTWDFEFPRTLMKRNLTLQIFRCLEYWNISNSNIFQNILVELCCYMKVWHTFVDLSNRNWIFQHKAVERHCLPSGAWVTEYTSWSWWSCDFSQGKSLAW